MIEFDSSLIPTSVKKFQRQILLAGLVLGSSSVLLLSGCSSALTSGLSGPSGETVVAAVKGKSHGGQFPVSGATIQIYSASAAGAGYAAASTPLGAAVTTDSNGAWSYGSFSCASGKDELYVVSTGGNPGLSGSVNNPALVLTAALGPCSQVDSISFVYIDEVTTVATEYALAAFSTDYLHVGTSSTNSVGLTNAFATVNNLVNIGTGQALTTTPAYATVPVPCTATPTSCTPNDTFRSIVPYDVINTLANVLASCVNTDGVSNPACSNLFAITGGSLALPAGSNGVVGIGASGTAGATNTADAALYIAHNPGLPNVNNFTTNNLSALFNLTTSTAPFGPALTAVPNDYTLTLNFVGGGLGGVKSTSTSGAAYLAIDQNGNIWLPSTLRSTVTELSNLGAPLSPTTKINVSTGAYRPTLVGGFTGGLGQPTRIAIDLSGNAWVADNQECVGGFSPSGTALLGSPFTTDCAGLSGSAVGLTVDPSNNVWVAYSAGITSINQSGAVRSGFPLTSGFDTLTNAFGPDYTGHVWIADTGNGHQDAINSNGSLYFQTTQLLPEASNYAAFGNLANSAGGDGGLMWWLSQPGGVENIQPSLLTGTPQQIDTFPTALTYPDSMQDPTGIAVDGNSRFYFGNLGGDQSTGNTVPPNITAYTSSVIQVSPWITGYTGGSELMGLDNPNGVAIDQSGNLWVINQSNLNYNGTTYTDAGGTYYGNGVNSANLTEFVGLAAPTDPVFAQAAANGQGAAGSYGVKP